jgi:hypothetical protein
MSDEAVTGSATRPNESPKTPVQSGPDLGPDAGFGPDTETDTDSGRPPPRTGRRRLIGVVAAVAVVALLATVWRLGGFDEQQRPFRKIAPGTPISAGPFELTFTEATAQHVLKTDYRAASWKIVVIGTGRTTGNETIAPQTGGTGSMLLARDQTTGDVKSPESQAFGSGEPSGGFTPGLPPVRYTVTFEFADGFDPADTLRFAVADQVYSSRALIKTGEDDEEWHNARDGWLMELPLSELPAEKD